MQWIDEMVVVFAKRMTRYFGTARGCLLVASLFVPSIVNAQVPFSDAIQVATGSSHTCVLRGTGTVQCWGGNDHGQLGDGGDSSQALGVNVPGLVDVVAITAGDSHTCALTVTGAVNCWGFNTFNQLGDGTSLDRHEPTGVIGLESGVINIAAGSFHTCALLDDGTVRCWGNNGFGQLGDGSTTSRATPATVLGIASGTIAIATGYAHTCALDQTGDMQCWGGNFTGQLGGGSTESRLTPTAVSGLASNVTAIVAGTFHTCALTSSGTALCWGDNGNGQLGDGSTTQWVVPVTVSGLTDGIALAAGAFHTCVLSQTAGTLCWGVNDSGQLGDGSLVQQTVPTSVVGLGADASSIDAGVSHTCVVLDDGSVWCWGSNQSGQQGNGTFGVKRTPTPVHSLGSAITNIDAGARHSCALSTPGDAFCWGSNTFGQLGDGSTANWPTPVAVAGLGSGVLALSTGTDHTCAISSDAEGYCWGNNSFGQLGDGSTAQRLTPTSVGGIGEGLVAIESGAAHSCALSASGGVWCWGSNHSGQLGNGSTDPSSDPVAVSGLDEGVVLIAIGSEHSCALVDGGAVYCWGANVSGQLGDNSMVQRPVPTEVVGLGSGIVDLSAGSDHTCARTSLGAVLCWGANAFGQLGDNSATQRLTPEPVDGLGAGVVAISAGGTHTCAIQADGSVVCWGNNSNGQLGDGSLTQRIAPTAVIGLEMGASIISAGRLHTCAVSVAATVCWGDNFSGQIGDGTEGIQAQPGQALRLERRVFGDGFE